MEHSLLLFCAEFPCWDEETARLAGEEPASLEALVAAGEAARLGGGCVLTPRGEAARQELAKAICVPASPVTEFVTDSAAASRALERNRMCQLLDRAFRQQWGFKEIACGETFPIVPELGDDGYFAFEDGRLKAVWPEHPLVASFLEAFSRWGVGARGFPAPGQAGLDVWARENAAPAGTLTIDFMLRSHADFEHYRVFKPMASDRFGFYNVDRLFAVKCGGDPRELLPLIGRLHVFLMEQRRVYVPGWYDLDADEQEDWTLLLLVTDGEAQLAELTAALRAWGEALIGPACPLYLLGSSVERLRAQKEAKDTIYDWFQEESVRILRPDAPDR